MRRLLSFVRGLPPRSATARYTTRDGQDWSNIEELLAAQLELTDVTNRILAGAHLKGGARWKPVTIKRPGYKRPKPLKMTPATMRRVTEIGSGKVIVEGPK